MAIVSHALALWIFSSMFNPTATLTIEHSWLVQPLFTAWAQHMDPYGSLALGAQTDVDAGDSAYPTAIVR
jgi:hypothetical protein